ncbi:hypothetical protein [Mycolicibacterium fortuitum]|uniref:hypothetical protein n=1 Tax=Mycolicibacterium fortuitum TaxID=1766 RepID=UPI001CE0F858|nr:hypothetical protein [Mycolicibacterium fortuitum]MCA4725276.1 hypothetical protein [Mycolicibacterium fortuitum]
MEVHDDPQQLVEELVRQHAQVLGEAHGDLAARHPEVPDRFVDQGSNVRPITVSCSVLETFLLSRLRRETPDSTLKVKAGNGMGVLLLDGKGSRIYVRKHPRNRRTGQLIETVPFVPGGEQYSIEEVLGHPIGGEEGIPEPQKYREYLLWWPDGRGFFGGAVLAAGLLLDNVEVLYGRTPLPPPIMEDRSFNVGLGGSRREGAGPGTFGTRRRDDDFAEVDEDAASDQDEEDGPPKSS